MQRMLDTLSTQNDVPIIFYGKLEDQFGNPVSDARITGTTIVNNGVTEGIGKFLTTSDANGQFTLDAGKGESLGIMPRKSGYALASPRALTFLAFSPAAGAGTQWGGEAAAALPSFAQKLPPSPRLRRQAGATRPAGNAS